MCRLLAINGNFKRKDAIDILMPMLDKNTDGTSCFYVKNNQFVIQKYALSLPEVLKRNNKFLDHLPTHKGWTIIHIRNGNVGLKLRCNAHGFISSSGNYCSAHNGSEKKIGNIIRFSLEKHVKWTSQTDSECLGELLARVGVKKFMDTVEYAGVFMSLHRKSGCLSIVKTNYNSDLEFLVDKNGRYLIASEFPIGEARINSKRFEEGYYIFNKDGQLVKNKKKETTTYTYNYGPAGGYNRYNYD